MGLETAGGGTALGVKESPRCRQVAIVQFSDDARTEFKLTSYEDKETLLDAIQHISYKGGNTKTGTYQGLHFGGAWWGQ